MNKIKNQLKELWEDKLQIIAVITLFYCSYHISPFLPQAEGVQQAWLQIALMAAQLGYGIYQSSKGAKQSKEAQRLLEGMPDYEIPMEAKKAMMASELQSMQGMPDEVKNEMLQQMDRSRMSSLQQINERRGGLGAVAQLEQKQQDSLRQLSIMDAQKREQNLQGLQAMRMNMAGYQDKAFQHENQRQMMMYQNTAGAASAMQGAGIQNMMGAATSAAMYGAQGGFDDMGGGAQRQAYGDYTGDLETTNVAAYNTYAQGAGEDAIGYTDWKGTPDSGYTAPQDFKPWRADMRAKGGDMPWGSDWMYNTGQKAKNIFSGIRAPFSGGGQNQQSGTSVDFTGFGAGTTGTLGPGNVGGVTGTYTQEGIARQAALSSGVIPSTNLSLTTPQAGGFGSPSTLSQQGPLYDPKITEGFTGILPTDIINSKTDNVVLQGALSTDELSDDNQLSLVALENDPSNVTVSDEFIQETYGIDPNYEVPIDEIDRSPSPAHQKLLDQGNLKIINGREEYSALVKPEMKDFKNSTEYMKARRQYYKDLELYEELEINPGGEWRHEGELSTGEGATGEGATGEGATGEGATVEKSPNQRIFDNLTARQEAGRELTPKMEEDLQKATEALELDKLLENERLLKEGGEDTDTGTSNLYKSPPGTIFQSDDGQKQYKTTKGEGGLISHDGGKTWNETEMTEEGLSGEWQWKYDGEVDATGEGATEALGGDLGSTIKENAKNYNIQFNEDGTINFTSSKHSSQESLDAKYGMESMSPATLLPYDSRVINSVLGQKKGKRTYSDDRKTSTREYEYGTKTVEQTEYGSKHTYKITNENHPLYGKEYIVKQTNNPDYLGKTSSEYKALNQKLAHAKPSEKADIQKEMDRIGKKYINEDISEKNITSSNENSSVIKKGEVPVIHNTNNQVAKVVVKNNPILSESSTESKKNINPVQYLIDNNLIGIKEEDKESVQIINDVFDELLSDSTLTKLPLTSDDKAWCGALVYEVLTKTNALNSISKSGAKPNSAEAYSRVRAKEYLNVGTPTDDPKIGDIIVVSREVGGKTQHHVAFYAGTDKNGNVTMIGGNQGNERTGGEVSFKTVTKNYTILGYRRLENMADIKEATAAGYRADYGVTNQGSNV